MGEPSNTFVVIMGVSIVFLSLICIIIICKIMVWLCNMKSDKTNGEAQEKNEVFQSEPINNRQEIIAAVSAVIAEELGTDISAIKVLSFKKI